MRLTLGKLTDVTVAGLQQGIKKALYLKGYCIVHA